MNPWGAIIGAVVGGMKAQQEERAAWKERNLEALKTRWSTFTGKGGQNVKQTDHLGRVMQGAMAGGMMGMGGDQGLSQPQNGYQMGNIPQSGQRGSANPGMNMQMQQQQMIDPSAQGNAYA